MYEQAEAVLDELIARTADNLRQARGKGATDDQALAALVGSFVAAAARQVSALAGATHYALALHRLVTNRAYIEQLEGQIAMLNTLDEIREM